MTAQGHQHAFLRPRPSARYQFSQGTLAGPRGRLAAPISDSCGRGLVLIDDPHRPGPTKLSTSQYDRLDGPNVQAHSKLARGTACALTLAVIALRHVWIRPPDPNEHEE